MGIHVCVLCFFSFCPRIIVPFQSSDFCILKLFILYLYVLIWSVWYSSSWIYYITVYIDFEHDCYDVNLGIQVLIFVTIWSTDGFCVTVDVYAYFVFVLNWLFHYKVHGFIEFKKKNVCDVLYEIFSLLEQ